MPSREVSRLSQTFSKASSEPLFTLKRFMAMNMMFSSAELAKAGDSSSQLKTDEHDEGSWHEPTLNAVARDRNRDHGCASSALSHGCPQTGAAHDVLT